MKEDPLNCQVFKKLLKQGQPKKDENVLSAKYITHTLEKLGTSKFREVFRITDNFQSAHTPLQAAAIDPTSLPLSPAGAPGAQGRISAAPAPQQLSSDH